MDLNKVKEETTKIKQNKVTIEQPASSDVDEKIENLKAGNASGVVTNNMKGTQGEHLIPHLMKYMLENKIGIVPYEM